MNSILHGCVNEINHEQRFHANRPVVLLATTANVERGSNDPKHHTCQRRTIGKKVQKESRWQDVNDDQKRQDHTRQREQKTN